MAKKRTLLIVLVALVLGAAGFGVYYGVAGATKVAGVSKVKNQPAQYLGKLQITGLVGKVYADQGVVEIVDEKACCNVFLLVPFTAQQQAALGNTPLYTGTLPAKGQALEAHGVLSETAEGFAFEVTKLTSGGETLVRRM